MLSAFGVELVRGCAQGLKPNNRAESIVPPPHSPAALQLCYFILSLSVERRDSLV